MPRYWNSRNLVDIISNPQLTPEDWASAVLTSNFNFDVEPLVHLAETLLYTLILPS